MLVLIIITNYNYGKFLHRCLRSCLSRSLHDNSYEIIIVDDCSKDDSIEIIKRYQKFLPNLKFLRKKT